MKSTHLITCLSAIALLASAAHGATIASFTFDSANGSSSDTETLTATSDITAAGSGLTAVTYASNQLEINGNQTAGDGGSRTIDITDNVYFSFDITVPAGVTLSLDQIAFGFGYNNSNGYTAQLRGSHDSFASILWSQGSGSTGNVAVAPKSADLSVLSGFQNVSNDTLEFRFYIADQSTSATRNFIFDDISVTGTAAVPEPSAALLGGLGVLMLFRRRR